MAGKKFYVEAWSNKECEILFVGKDLMLFKEDGEEKTCSIKFHNFSFFSTSLRETTQEKNNMIHFKAKIDTPICAKGDLFPHNFTFTDIKGNINFPEDFPDVFIQMPCDTQQEEFKIMSPAVNVYGGLSPVPFETKEEFEKWNKGNSGWSWPATQIITLPDLAGGDSFEQIVQYKVPVRSK
jgi:hypothetical protein